MLDTGGYTTHDVKSALDTNLQRSLGQARGQSGENICPVQCAQRWRHVKIRADMNRG